MSEVVAPTGFRAALQQYRDIRYWLFWLCDRSFCLEFFMGTTGRQAAYPLFTTKARATPQLAHQYATADHAGDFCYRFYQPGF